MLHSIASGAGRGMNEVTGTMAKPAIIVINSHVVRGSVGGRASVFVLERMGFPVWSVPTVAFPWHLGHGRATRIAADAAAFRSQLADLAGAPWLGEVGAVLSGYLGSAEQAGPIADLVEAARQANRRAIYLCDPIVGDSDGLFQPPAVAEAIRDRLLPLADITTPNRHELAWLTGRDLANNADVVAASRRLGVAETVVTSAFAPAGEIGTAVIAGDEAHLATHRRVAEAPHGTGDLFAALHLGHRLDGAPPVVAVERALSSVLALIDLAAETGADEMPLAAGQGAFLAPPSGVTLAPLAQAGGGGLRKTPRRKPR